MHAGSLFLRREKCQEWRWRKVIMYVDAAPAGIRTGRGLSYRLSPGSQRGRSECDQPT